MTNNQAWQPMLDSMNALRRDKLDGWKIFLIERFPPVKELEAITYIGSFAWTQPHTKEKYIRERFTKNIGGGVVTPSDIARDYIAVKFQGERLRCTTSQYDYFVRNRKHQPLYAEPVNGMECFYVDLKSAYWQIMMLGGWDVDYNPNKYMSVRSDVFDFPCPHFKLARNTLISIGLPGKSTIWNPNEGFQQLRSGGGTVNLVLYGFAMDFLHCFASEMIDRAGAVYVNTDGYIIPKYELNRAFKIADEWGVTLTIRYDGIATVRGAGDYDIANYRSKRPRVTAHPHKYINPPDIRWFKSRWIGWAHRINMDYRGMAL